MKLYNWLRCLYASGAVFHVFACWPACLIALEPALSDPPDVQEIYIAVSRAQQIHERNLRGLSWEHVTHADVLPGEWGRFASVRGGFDDLGRWFLDGHMFLREDETTSRLRLHHFKYAYDGRRVRAVSANSETGLIRSLDSGEPYLMSSPLPLAWEHYDEATDRRLSELLLDADRRQVRWVDQGDHKHLELRSQIVIGIAALEFVQIVDPYKDFLPVSNHMLDLLLRTPYSIRCVDEWKRVGDTWIPVRGRQFWYSRPTPIEDPQAGRQYEAFSAELRRLGFVGDPDPLDENTQKLFRTALQNVFGSVDGMPKRKIGLGQVELEVVNIFSVNQPVDAAKLQFQLPAVVDLVDTSRHMIVDAITGRDIRRADIPDESDSPK